MSPFDAPSPARVRSAARRLLGYEELLPGQEEAIRSVVGGRDTLAVMPTGSGKSAVYQLAGALMPGATVVISPLIALQRDQLRAIAESETGAAAMLNSALPAGEQQRAIAGAGEGDLEFLLLAPEQLARDEVRQALVELRPSLFVVDEAHCVSEWGHDFRPDYLRLGETIERVGRPVVLALTATAAPPIRAEIVERLGMREAATIISGFDRPNISLAVVSVGDRRLKRERLIEAVVGANKPGIVYSSTRRGAEELADEFAAAGVRAAAYHAGLAARRRSAVQDEFMSEHHPLEVIVATIAFGMGIDKPDVRFVFHAEGSESLDAYYQEIGRAGRDGEPARAILFYRAEDLGLRRYFAARAKLDPVVLRRTMEHLAEADGPVALGELARLVKVPRNRLRRLLDRLYAVGALTLEGEFASVRAGAFERPGDAALEAELFEERRRRYDQSRVEMMRAYAETRDCRRRFLLNYFGEAYEGRCGRCDNDQRPEAEQPSEVAPPAAEQPFALNSRLRHRTYGLGTLQDYEGERMVVLFDDEGYKTLDVPHTVAEGLVEPA